MADQRTTRSHSLAKFSATKSENISSQPNPLCINSANPLSVVDHATSAQTVAKEGRISLFWATSDELPNIELLPQRLTSQMTGLNNKEDKLMLSKQRRLRGLDLPRTCAKQDRFVNRSSASRAKREAVSVEEEGRALAHACAATMVFASESAGTAVCIDESGLLLTCAHCIAESEDEFRESAIEPQKSIWLLSASGRVVKARCVAWDERRDLALLKVVATQADENRNPRRTSFRSISVSTIMCKRYARICCVGHPGSEDLEAEQEGVSTDYPILAVSEGKFLGYAAGQGIQDNSEIGALKHDAWTYWGHSGAPIVDTKSGKLVGLHSSWDEETGTRRGVGVEAIQGFLDQFVVRDRNSPR